jgi:hypothetical protein
MSEANPPSNIPNPDPSLATKEHLEDAKAQLRREIAVTREESKGWSSSTNERIEKGDSQLQKWIENLQEVIEDKIKNGDSLLAEKIIGGLRNIGTRLDGNDTALVAALKAQKEEAAKQTENFKEVLGEIKAGIAKQFDSLLGQINEVKERMSEAGGQRSGTGQTLSLVIAGVAAIAAVVSVAIVIATKG